MDEDQKATGSTDTGSPVRRAPSGRTIAIIAAIAVLLLGAIFGAISWYATTDERSDAQRKSALAASWSEAQSQEAPGVDFEMKIRDDQNSEHTALHFDHSGIVTATDSCFEATSSYMVLEDGSLAIENLSSPWTRSESAACEGRIGEIFWTSRVSFEDGSWVLRDGSGKVISSGFKEFGSPFSAGS